MENSLPGIKTPIAVPKRTRDRETSSKKAVLILRKWPSIRKKMTKTLIINPFRICGFASFACSYSPPHSIEIPCGRRSCVSSFWSSVVTFITFTPSTTSAITVIVRLPFRCAIWPSSHCGLTFAICRSGTVLSPAATGMGSLAISEVDALSALELFKVTGMP